MFVPTISPRITTDPDGLTVSTSRLAILFTLGLKTRRVTVSRHCRKIIIQDRTAWFWNRTQTLTFDGITAITYGYQEAIPSPFAARDPIDRFLIGLLLRTGRELRLFNFIGDGGFTNDGILPDWLYWEERLLDFQGSQESESRLLAKLLSKILNVPVQPSTLISD